METVINRYTTALDELNILVKTSYHTTKGDNKEQSEQVADDLLSLLIIGYTLGIGAAAEMLGYNLVVDIGKMQSAIFSQIDGKTFEDRAAEHVSSGSLGRLQALAESEFHRVFNTAEMDGAQEYQACTGQAVMKTWSTMLDEKVRDTHDYLEGVSVLYGEDFFTYDGDHAACPGGFTKVENNANCRCIILLHKN